MTYTGYVDGKLLFSNTRPEQYGILSGTISNIKNASAQFEFTLSPSNENKELIVPRKSLIEVTENDRLIFRGTVSTIKKNFDGSRSFTAEDILSNFNDVLKAPFSLSSVSAASIIEALVFEYNAAAGPWSKLSLGGEVTVKGTVSMTHDKEFVSLFDVLSELISKKGGYARLRYDENGLAYLDYLSDGEINSAQEVRFGKNLVDISEQIDTDTLLSRVYPTGLDGLTIAGVNDGRTYLINPEVEAIYGRIDKPFNADTDDAATLKSYAQAYLTRYAAERNSISLTALDLSKLDKSLNSFAVGQKVRVISPPHGIDADMPVVEVKTDVVSPSRSKITLGASQRTLTGNVSGASGAGMSIGTNGAKGDTGDAGATFTPHLDAAGNLSWTNDKGLPNPETVNVAEPAAAKLTPKLSEYLPLKGGIMQGDLDMTGSQLTASGVRVEGSLSVDDSSDIHFGGNVVHGVAAPVEDFDAANKQYVDNASKPVAIEGTLGADQSTITVTTPNAFQLVAEAWSDAKHPLVAFRIDDEAYAYLSAFSADPAMAIFSIPAAKLFHSTPPRTIILDGGNTAMMLEALDSQMSDTSTAAVQNKVVKKYVDDKTFAKEDISNKISAITADSTDGEYPSAKAVRDYVAANAGGGGSKEIEILTGQWDYHDDSVALANVPSGTLPYDYISSVLAAGKLPMLKVESQGWDAYFSLRRDPLNEMEGYQFTSYEMTAGGEYRLGAVTFAGGDAVGYYHYFAPQRAKRVFYGNRAASGVLTMQDSNVYSLIEAALSSGQEVSLEITSYSGEKYLLPLTTADSERFTFSANTGFAILRDPDVNGEVDTLELHIAMCSISGNGKAHFYEHIIYEV